MEEPTEPPSLQVLTCSVNAVLTVLLKTFPVLSSLPLPLPDVSSLATGNNLWHALLWDRIKFDKGERFASRTPRALGLREDCRPSDILEEIRSKAGESSDLGTWVSSFSCRCSYAMECEDCGSSNNELSERAFLPLGRLPPTGSDLQQQIDSSLGSRVKDNELKFECRKCMRVTQHLRSARQFDPPPVLPVLLDPRQAQAVWMDRGAGERKQWERPALEQLEFGVNEELSVPSISEGSVSNRSIYHLLGVIAHTGPSLSMGHNSAIIRDPKDGEWAVIHDSTVVDTMKELLHWNVNLLPVLVLYQLALSPSPPSDEKPVSADPEPSS